jgi:energy-coupling factor transporter transmembrane protein EcfT
MYCSKCGEADQNENIYCRKCGSFRLDSLKKEMTILLIGNLFVLGSCLFLSIFWIVLYILCYLIEIPTPNIFDLAKYGVLVSFLSILFSNFIFFSGTFLKMKKNNVRLTSEQMDSELTNLETNNLLPPADFQSIIPSVVEDTTRNLEKVRRNN